MQAKIDEIFFRGQKPAGGVVPLQSVQKTKIPFGVDVMVPEKSVRCGSDAGIPELGEEVFRTRDSAEHDGMRRRMVKRDPAMNAPQ